MYKTKITRKGQITIPSELREKLDIAIGNVLLVDITGESLIVRKPRNDIEKLFGAWKHLSDKDITAMKKAWAGWNEKDISRL